MGSIMISTGQDVLKRYFSGAVPAVKSGSRESYKVPIACAIVRDLPPRDEDFEYFLEMGRGYIDPIFEQTDLGLPKDGYMYMVFPERWMSCQEQRYLIVALCAHPQAQEIKGLYIITSSPILIGEMYGENVILDFPDKKKHVQAFESFEPAVDKVWG
jgi:hypothetical protein